MGIRTPDTLVGHTRFPIVLLRPARTSLHNRLVLAAMLKYTAKFARAEEVWQPRENPQFLDGDKDWPRGTRGGPGVRGSGGPGVRGSGGPAGGHRTSRSVSSAKGSGGPAGGPRGFSRFQASADPGGPARCRGTPRWARGAGRNRKTSAPRPAGQAQAGCSLPPHHVCGHKNGAPKRPAFDSGPSWQSC